jgi:hypothetical protein
MLSIGPEAMGANTKYKDSVFSFLFSDPDLLRELYCALEGVDLPPDTPITINTLRDVLFKDRINGVSFEIGGKLVVLIERQSTINPNMALRLLLYIARVYEKVVGDKNVYASSPIPLPRPEFFVLYNGVSPYPDEETLKLFESFERASSLGLPGKETPSLELVARVININPGRYCRDHDILKGFLEANASEVMNMLMTEWNWDDALAEGASVEFVQKITGLGIEAVEKIKEKLQPN